jgi:hypothetical protein
VSCASWRPSSGLSGGSSRSISGNSAMYLRSGRQPWLRSGAFTTCHTSPVWPCGKMCMQCVISYQAVAAQKQLGHVTT